MLGYLEFPRIVDENSYHRELMEVLGIYEVTLGFFLLIWYGAHTKFMYLVMYFLSFNLNIVAG